MSQIEISNWRPVPSGALRGYFSAILPSGMKLNECSLFEKDGRAWVNLPQKCVERDGQKRYYPHIEFVDRSVAERFKGQVIAALVAKGIVHDPGNHNHAGPRVPARNTSSQSSSPRDYSDLPERADDPLAPPSTISDEDIPF